MIWRDKTITREDNPFTARAQADWYEAMSRFGARHLVNLDAQLDLNHRAPDCLDMTGPSMLDQLLNRVS